MTFVENEYKALVAELEKENEERRRLKDPNKPEHVSSICKSQTIKRCNFKRS